MGRIVSTIRIDPVRLLISALVFAVGLVLYFAGHDWGGALGNVVSDVGFLLSVSVLVTFLIEYAVRVQHARYVLDLFEQSLLPLGREFGLAGIERRLEFEELFEKLSAGDELLWLDTYCPDQPNYQEALRQALTDGAEIRMLAVRPNCRVARMRAEEIQTDGYEPGSFRSAAESHIRSIWMGVSLALSCLADPRVLDAVSPPDGEHFDPEEFLLHNGTLYLLATGAGAGASWSLVAAFIEDLVETARHLAATSPGARLDPPVLLALDEIGNLSPLPSLPVLMAEGGGTGITTMPVLQSLSQARHKWGDHAAGAIWDASIVKIILGGTSSARDLQDLSALIGERDEHTDTISVGDYGSRSLQRSTRRVPVMPPEIIRTLPFGTALVLLRTAPPLVTDLLPWTDRRDSESIRNQRTEVEDRLRHR